MKDRSITVVVDAMGGDNAPQDVLQGVELALARSESLHVALAGRAEVVEEFSSRFERCTPLVAPEVIEMGEHPAQAVRKKKQSSLVVGCKEVAAGNAEGFFSCGSTGACLAAATLHMGRIKGISRPMLATVVPAPAKPVVLCDVGANAECKPEYLVQFALMGTVYLREIMGVSAPEVGLLNIGTEEAKGTELCQEAFALMKAGVPGFCGNAEPYDVLSGKYDLVVSDGFSGNICLKTIEATAKVLFSQIKGVMKKSAVTMLAASVLKSGLKELAASLDADTYGGAPLLGVKGACIVGHGSAGAQAVCNGILATAAAAEARIAERIADSLDAVAPGANDCAEVD